jgi:hypothetical protein
MLQAFVGDQSSSRGESQFCYAPNTGDFATPEIPIQVCEMLLKVVQSVSLRPIVRVFL